ncbi:hypothetical protein HPNQ4216_1699 [Helicobacter pylori NQ4216]|nr:hypothetical protein HPNQ4216_1699 [Helicobacter pylori NQ4216]
MICLFLISCVLSFIFCEMHIREWLFCDTLNLKTLQKLSFD